MPKLLPNPPYEIKDCGYLTPCWLWLGCTRRGYGLINNPNYNGIGKKMIQAHVYFYEKNIAPIPPGLILDHLCNIRRCINFNHMEPKTHEENIRRGDVPKINIEIAKEIRASHENGISQTSLARIYGISQATVSQIIRKITWI